MLPVFFVLHGERESERLFKELAAHLPLQALQPPIDRELLRQQLPCALIAPPTCESGLLRDLKGAPEDSGVFTLLLADAIPDLETPDADLWDDFVLRPWRATEVGMRLRRLSRQRPSEHSDHLRWQDLTIDVDRHEARVGPRLLDLTFTEFRLLLLLASLGGRVMTRERAFGDIWGTGHFGGLRTVDVHIRRLRTKLEACDCPYIATVRNVGYRLIA